ncbi:MAG: excisionase [Deltaproteobacteria bacterium]|nr:excisionase [Deltaproteobacteria bacterium]
MEAVKTVLTHKDTPVMDVALDATTAGVEALGAIHDEELVPLGTRLRNGSVNGQSFQDWWRGRCVPGTRNDVKEALEPFGSSFPARLLPRSLSLSLSDHYWLRPEDKPLAWKDVNFFENDFSEAFGNLLFGKKVDPKDLDFNTPDLTTSGWQKKRWSNGKGKRVLVKAGSPPYHQEPHNEVMASRLMTRLGIENAGYVPADCGGEPLTLCDCFASEKAEFVPALHIFWSGKRRADASDMGHFLRRCRDLNIPEAGRSLKEMLALDFMIANDDRNYENFGAMRDGDTLRFLGLAPVYDCGTSLWHDSPEPDSRRAPAKPFKKTQAEQIRLADDLSRLDFGLVKDADEEFDELLADNPLIDEERRGKLCRALKERIAILSDIARGGPGKAPGPSVVSAGVPKEGR